MVKLSKLYTREGDAGETGLVGGARVKKNAAQVAAYGDVDELNSWMGIVRSRLNTASLSNATLATELQESLVDLQQTLFDIGAELATPPDSEWKPPSTVSAEDVTQLEEAIDDWTSQVDELKSFLLPGGSETTSCIHVARCVCRRTERSVIDMAETVQVREEVPMFLNRLSDWLFALARVVAKELGEEETLWDTTRAKKGSKS